MSRNLYKSHSFMQNKPNFRKSQMNVNTVIIKDYEKRTLGERGKNKPNSNPILYPLAWSVVHSKRASRTIVS
jgi:hypothetical protein